MRWQVHGERRIYTSEWVTLALADVEVPAVGSQPAHRFEHHVVRSDRPASGTVVLDEVDGTPSVLLLWRHRFITDTWGWEIPAGGVDEGESSLEAAGREVLEETGWAVGGEAGTVEHLVDYFPANGMADKRFDLFLARGADHVGDPTDPAESERIEWVPVSRLRGEVAAGRVGDGMSLTALLWCLAFGLL
ncbi:NUDIX domain-containing protein [Dermatobacter hominis]|uniref:NUDIX domain-containing protein n=1 Tax=Dermatobacter hominis TaxID=2884263 RepID=UPI001D1275E3|nr:NUDIX hydrolase [Dermatobacter hominis]UDY37794.1 NUDIX hydrolase [Dermatobacter hominis]